MQHCKCWTGLMMTSLASYTTLIEMQENLTDFEKCGKILINFAEFC